MIHVEGHHLNVIVVYHWASPNPFVTNMPMCRIWTLTCSRIYDDHRFWSRYGTLNKSTCCHIALFHFQCLVPVLISLACTLSFIVILGTDAWAPTTWTTVNREMKLDGDRFKMHFTFKIHLWQSALCFAIIIRFAPFLSNSLFSSFICLFLHIEYHKSLINDPMVQMQCLTLV